MNPRGIFPPRTLVMSGLKLSAFRTEHYDSKKRKVMRTLCVTTPDKIVPQIQKALKNGRVIVLKDEYGQDVAYEKDGRDKCEFVFFRTKQQDKNLIELFPWEMKSVRCAYCKGTGTDPNSLYVKRPCEVCKGLGKCLV